MSSSSPLQVAVIGGLGLMASPMAKHWTKDAPVRVLRVHDRGTVGESRDKARAAWQAYGAELLSSMDSVLGSDLEGVFICCGKNGDDIDIIKQVAGGLREGAFICHLSTVSTAFIHAAEVFCTTKKLRYVNYPLTGGPIGAEQAKMLILAGGDKTMFDRLEPPLSYLGVPRYFGESITAGAEVKLIGHLMVFNGLMGVCSAVSVHTESFANGILCGDEQSDFFDFLNGGAGGSNQWNLITRSGIKDDIWDRPFLIKYAVVDALYAVELCMKRKVSYMVSESLLQVALAFSYVLNHTEGDLATHAIVREMIASKAGAFDQFVLEHSAARGDINAGMDKCIQSLPESIQETVALEVTVEDFC